MKRALGVLLVVALSIAMTLPAIAGEKEQLEAQLTLRQTQMRAVTAEFQLAQGLVKNLQNEAAMVNQEIARIRAQLKAIEPAEEKAE